MDFLGKEGRRKGGKEGRSEDRGWCKVGQVGNSSEGMRGNRGLEGEEA